jgi:hypothetical protein
MPKGRQSPFNADQLAEIVAYISKFERQVHKHDPKMQGDGKKALTQWKQKRAEKIIKKPAFKDMPKENASEWKKVRLVSGILHFLTTMPLGYRSQVHKPFQPCDEEGQIGFVRLYSRVLHPVLVQDFRASTL